MLKKEENYVLFTGFSNMALFTVFITVKQLCLDYYQTMCIDLLNKKHN